MSNKKEILRLDIGSRTKFPKREMIRIVKTDNQIVIIDINQNIAGRGAYLKKDLSSLNKAIKNNALNKALRCKVEDNIYLQLEQIINN